MSTPLKNSMISKSVISIRGARVHNLKNIDLDIPTEKLVCFSGPSGSGKSSLAFHTLLTESKRRFVNSFPNSVKFFIERPAPVDVDSIYPVLPVFGLPQINPILSSRSQVCDVMQLLGDLQNLYFAYSAEYCPKHEVPLKDWTLKEQLIEHFAENVSQTFHVFLHQNFFKTIYGHTFFPSRSYQLERKSLESFQPEDDLWEIFRIKGSQLDSLCKNILEIPYPVEKLDFYFLNKSTMSLKKFRFNCRKRCPYCSFSSKSERQISSFSPYSALGACKNCRGYGANLVYDEKKMIHENLSIHEGAIPFLDYAPFSYAKNHFLKLLKKQKISLDVPLKNLDQKFFDLLYQGEGPYPGILELQNYLEIKKYKPSVRVLIKKFQKEVSCEDCFSSRIDPQIQNFKINFAGKSWSIQKILNFTILEIHQFFENFWHESYQNDEVKRKAEDLVRQMREKLKTAINLGLGHLSLLRKTKTLSAGEYQRLLLIKYLSFQGSDSLFVLDEPSLGLNEKEILHLIDGLRHLIDQGNSVIVVDHSKTMQISSDHLVMMGPGSGSIGGEIVYQGLPDDYFKKAPIVKWPSRVSFSKYPQYMTVKSPEIYGHRYSDFKIPTHDLTWVTGPSGSGKTSLMIKILANEIHFQTNGSYLMESEFTTGRVSSPIEFKDVILFSSELNRFTSRSTVGTLTELATVVRKHFLKLPAAKSMGLKDGHLSANSELGMCLKCQGKGFLTIEMQYLEDVTLECEDCKGKKVKPLYANLSDGSMTVAEAYNKPLNELLLNIDLTPKFRRVFEYLKILNLDYLSLERPLNSLSGGERQRIYLLSKLLKSIDHSLLVFENLSFGLSQGELLRMGELLKDLVRMKNTVVVIDACEDFKNMVNWMLEVEARKVHLVPLK